MTSNRSQALIGQWLLYLAIAIILIFILLLPLRHTPPAWAGPDLLLALTLAWAIRCPKSVPMLLVAAVFLIADFLLQRPPGLLTVLVVIAVEELKTRAINLQNVNFLGEWVVFSFAITLVIMLYWQIQALIGVEHAPWTLSLTQVTTTIIAYPLVVIVSRVLFGVRKIPPTKDIFV
ncbi:MAG: rod shape-determining protein MreD [Aestuariivita sp.]|nr:rod shape-determining protein MreD [Aestuariivita sp.]MCY4201487.1 rod shape-determining protein MreD [Aestuariivita sp.]